VTDLKRFGATGRGKADGQVPEDAKTHHETDADPQVKGEAAKLKANGVRRSNLKRKGPLDVVDPRSYPGIAPWTWMGPDTRSLNVLDPRMHLPEGRGGLTSGKKSIKSTTATVNLGNVGQGPNATAALDPGDYGICDTETVTPTVTAHNDGTDWHLAVTALRGDYSKVVRLPAGCQEATVGAATAANYRHMIDELRSLNGTDWYALQAVDNHESVHETRLKPALKKVEPKIQKWFQALTVPLDVNTMNNAGQAVAAIQATPAYANLLGRLRDLWDAKYVDLIWADHQMWTDKAERKVTDPRIKAIKAAAKANNW